MEREDAEVIARRQGQHCGHEVYVTSLTLERHARYSVICFDCLPSPCQAGQRLLVKVCDFNELTRREAELRKQVAHLTKELGDMKKENAELRALPDAPDYLAAKADYETTKTK